jgi:hypothetical protein
MAPCPAGRPDYDGVVKTVAEVPPGVQTDSGKYAYIPFGVAFDEESAFGGYTIPSLLRADWCYGTDRYVEFFPALIEEAVFG